MTTPNEQKLASYLKRATEELRRTRDRVTELESELESQLKSELESELDSGDDPIAVVSMACRYPGGVRTPEDLWRLVIEGGDAIGAFPDDRGWDLDHLADRCDTTRGGFLDGAGDFDAAFFGMTPREALATDPQQRLLLEVAWEAVERAGIDPSALRATPTGVFAGFAGQTYTDMDNGPDELRGYLLAGSAASVASGRIAYALGLHGPAITVDTACSSSLVALHLAAQALRRGDCTLALVGGVTVMSTPGAWIEFSRQQGLAVDGRCKSFGVGADGTGWAEGVGVLLVERLSDARRLGHPVVGVVRGSALNQDGASNGLTAPSGSAQERVIRAAWVDAGVSGAGVDLVEGHGTGTRLGDPIEAGALLATYGRERGGGDPVWLGSLKSNIGHTSAAAGVGGVIKTLLALRYGIVPPTLHADEPTTVVDWSAGAVRLAVHERPWPRVPGRVRRAGVSSFGISGTNAHVIIEEPPEPPTPGTEIEEPPEPTTGTAAERTGTPVLPLVVTAATPGALRGQLHRVRDHVAAAPDDTLPDVAYSLATTRAVLPYRTVVCGRTREQLLQGLTAAADGATSAPGPTPRRRKVGMVFSGQGAQRAGMGGGLSAAFPLFAEVFADVCGRFPAELAEAIATGDGLDRTAFAQPALFAYQVALFRLVESWGVRPSVVAGHSVGEIAAAHVAGVLGLDDAVALVGARARLMGELPAGGVMVAVAASSERVRPLLTAGVSIAAVNGPESVVVSGEAAAVDAVVEALGEVWSRRLRVSHAFHSPLMDPMLDTFGSVVRGLRLAEPSIPLVSGLTGRTAGPGEVTDPEYWVRQVREPVRFADAVATMAEADVEIFVEVGPGAVLTGMIADAPVAVALGRGGGDEAAEAAAGLCELFTAGVPVEWEGFFAGRGARRTDLPTYAFDHRHYWQSARSGADRSTTGHPLLTSALEAPEGGRVTLTGQLTGAGTPATVWVEAALRAADEVDCTTVDTLTVDAAPPPRGGLRLQVTVEAPDAHGRRDLRVHGRPSDGAAWVRYAHGTLSPIPSPPPPAVAPSTVAEACTVDGEETERYVLHPGLLSAATGHRAVLRWRGVRAYAAGADSAHVAAAPPGGPELLLTDRAGRVLATVDEVTYGDPPPVLPADGLYRVVWTPVVLPPAEGPVPRCERVSATDPLHRVLDIAQRDLAGEPSGGTPLVVLTQGAVAVDGEAPSETAPVWGLLRSAQSEHPGRFVLVDAPDAPPSLLAAIAASGEPQVAVRDGRVLVPRLAPAPAPTGTPGWPTDGTVLITGGTGALGALVARHLAAHHGVRHLVLTSRSGLRATGATALVEELAELGTRAAVETCDVADRAALAAVLERIPADRPLRAVVHTAGVLDDGTFTALTPRRLETAMRPKADAARHLDELTRGHDLAAFVLFSSVSGILGGPGQANYAAANTALDALAHRRAAAGLPAVSVAWGPWTVTGGGMSAAADLHRVAREGFTALSAEHGTALLDAAVAGAAPLVVACPIDWETVRAQAPVPPLLRGVARRGARYPAAGAGSPMGLAEELAALSDTERGARVLSLVRTHVAALLGLTDPDTVPTDASFPELGFDSLGSVQLRQRLDAATGQRLPPSLVFDHPTPRSVADRLLRDLRPAAPEDRVHDEPRTDIPAADTLLPADILPTATTVPAATDPREVLLTGATGFIGAFLLRDLMRTTRATVRCLVRGTDRADALRRLTENMRWYEAWDDVDTDRLDIIVGDLARPRLGLTDEHFDELARSVDLVLHAGAHVNWLQPYAALKDANVGGTAELLRLAARSRTVPLHHISTTGVFTQPVTAGVPLRPEDPIGPPEELRTGYTQSKWVAEQLLDQARERGLPVTVHRVDLVSGDQRRGACQTRDFVWLSVKGMIQARAVPAGLGGSFQLVPVDYVSAAVLALARRPDAAGRTFHLSGRSSISFADIVAHLRSFGHELPELDRVTWRDKVTADRANALLPLLESFEAVSGPDATDVYLAMDSSATDAALADTGIVRPEPTRELFRRYDEFFTRTGYFPR
ncbi:thioester reductase domain-containing protein [Streptomyces sp. NPDC000594]|uniref:thioester reductase domain-containing protein n=1 Tax=Streptomyces sp. NPDC000594 TaxID=3154261 RepID=UPI00331BFC74